MVDDGNEFVRLPDAGAEHADEANPTGVGGNGTPIFSKAAVVAASQEKRTIVPLDIRGRGRLFILKWKSRDKDKWQKSLLKGKPGRQQVTLDDISASMFQHSVVNGPDDPTLMLPPGGVTDGVPNLEIAANLDADITSAVMAANRELNDVSDEDIEELMGNSGRRRSSGRS